MKYHLNPFQISPHPPSLIIVVSIAAFSLVCMMGFEMERLDTLNTSTHLPTTEEVGDYVPLSMQLFREKHERAHSLRSQ